MFTRCFLVECSSQRPTTSRNTIWQINHTRIHWSRLPICFSPSNPDSMSPKSPATFPHNETFGHGYLELLIKPQISQVAFLATPAESIRRNFRAEPRRLGQKERTKSARQFALTARKIAVVMAPATNAVISACTKMVS